MKVILHFFRMAAKIVLNFIKNRIILWVFAVALGLLFAELTIVLGNILTQMNKTVLSVLYKAEDFVFRIQSKLLKAGETVAQWFADQVFALLDVVPADIEFYLAAVNFVAFLQTFVADMVNSLCNSVGAIVSAAMEPLSELISYVDIQLEAVKGVLTGLQDDLAYEYEALFGDWILSAEDQINDYNLRIEDLQARIDQVETWYNEDIDALSQCISAEIATLNAFDGQAPQRRAQIHNMIVSMAQNGSLDPEAVRAFAVSISNPSTSGLTSIPWGSYLYTIDPGNLALSFSPAPYTFDVCLTGGPVAELQAAIQDLSRFVDGLPANLQNRMESAIPSILGGEWTGRINALLVLAITKLLRAKADALSAKVSELKARILEAGTTAAAEIAAKAAELMQEIEEMERRVIDNLPNLLEPAVLKYIEKIKEKMAREMEDEAHAMEKAAIEVNMEEVRLIMESMTGWTAKEDPAVKPADVWTLGEVYRVLCNHFFRVERLALVCKLAPEDLGVSLDELLQLLEGDK